MPAALEPTVRQLPPDCVLLPLQVGALLVSPSRAVFCRVLGNDVTEINRCIITGGTVGHLSPELCASLTLHGFFCGAVPAPARNLKLRLQLTNRCNLACRYCCTDSGSPRVDELTFEQWLSLVDEACHFAGPNLGVDLLGGEPLLMPGALRLADSILDRGCRLTLYTNGKRLAEHDIAAAVGRLQSSGAEIRVSLAAASKALCDELSGGERFDPLMKGLLHPGLDAARTRLDIMLFPQNVDDICQHLPSLRRALPGGMRVTLGLAFCGGREMGDRQFESPAQLQSALDKVALYAGESIAAETLAPTAPRREACRCAFGRELSVRSDSMLYTCFRMLTPVGRYTPGTLDVTWRRVLAAPRLARMTETCSACPLVSLCGGGCQSDNHIATGDGERPDCGLWRVRLLCEMLAEGNIAALEWPTRHLRAEARRRGLHVPGEPNAEHRTLPVVE